MLAGDQYLAQANENRVRDERIPAPRGEIVDRNGTTIVDSRLANVVQIDPRSLPRGASAMRRAWGQQAPSGRAPGASSAQQGAPAGPRAAAAADARRAAAASASARSARVLEHAPDDDPERVVRRWRPVPYATIRVRIDVPRRCATTSQERKDHSRA